MSELVKARKHLLRDNSDITTMTKSWCLEACDIIEKLEAKNKNQTKRIKELENAIKTALPTIYSARRNYENARYMNIAILQQALE